MRLAHKSAVTLCDRGTLDGLAYWPGESSSFWRSLGTTRAEELAHYPAVIHLRVPSHANGYGHSNPLRIESPEEAATIDDRILDAWSGHPRRSTRREQRRFHGKGGSGDLPDPRRDAAVLPAPSRIGSSRAVAGGTSIAKPRGVISVSQMMSPETFQFDGREPVRDAAAELLSRGLHGAPVVDRTGRLLGVVSQIDFLRAMLSDQGSGWRVADVATKPALTVFPEDGVYEAAERMVRAGVHRLPVVDHTGRLLGVLTPMDVLRGIVNLEEGFRVRKAPGGEDTR